jgi:hypothetical protein
MINEDNLIQQLSNESDCSTKVRFVLQYRNECITKGFEIGWEKHCEDLAKSKSKRKQLILDEKNRLLDELHTEIWNINLALTV